MPRLYIRGCRRAAYVKDLGLWRTWRVFDDGVRMRGTPAYSLTKWHMLEILAEVPGVTTVKIVKHPL